MNLSIPRPGICAFLSLLGLTCNSARAADGPVTASHVSEGYRSPGICTVTCEFGYPSDRPLRSLVWFVSPPAGWQISSVGGNETGEIQGNTIVFLSSLTNRPVRFSYTVTVPAGELGWKALSGSAEYMLGTPEMTNQVSVLVSPDPLPLSQQMQVIVTSPYGGCTPPVGTNIYNAATNLPLAVTTSPVTAGETRYVCTGWTGTGSIGAGIGTNTQAAITNDSEISWLWKTQHTLALSNTTGGSVTEASGWRDSGSNVAVTANTLAHYQFAGWTGDTNGCILAGTQITIPMDGPRHVGARFLLDSHSLQITSPYGSPQPAAGTDYYEYGTSVPCAVTNSPVAAGETQYVCTGWTGTGSVIPGSGTNTVVTIGTDSTLAWLWKTQYLFTVTHTTGGAVTEAGGWYDAGGSAQVTATPDLHYHLAGWEGQTNGCLIEGDRITVPMSDARHVQARFELDIHKLIVVSGHGGAIPPEGTNLYDYGLSVPCSVTNSPVVDGSYRYVCTGWTGMGSVTAGTGTNVQVVLTNDSGIAWLWKTQCWLSVTGAVGGDVVDVSGWYDTTSSVTVTAVAAAHNHFAQWQGSTNGCSLNGDRITVPMGIPRSITATFALDQQTLEVRSAYGDTDPAAGTNRYDYGTSVPCAAKNSPVQAGSTRYVCTGWNGWGSVTPGSGTNTQITLTNDSGIVWLWQTQFWMTATAGTGGTVSVTNGWYDQGSPVGITALSAPHYHFGGWSGQTNGCVISSNQITLAMDGPRAVAATFDLDQHTATVSSKFGTAVPPAGTNVFYYGTNLVFSIIDSPVVNLTTQYVCSGWTGSGSIPSSGTKTNTAVITLTNNSAITWKWGTNVWLNLAAGAGGSIKTNRWSDWYTAGSVVSNIEATASNNYHFTTWSGDTNGCTITTNKLSAPMTGARSLTASFALDEYRIVVASKYGTPTPPVGTNLFVYGSNTFCAIPDSPVLSGFTQYVCTGWSGTGSVPTSGSATNTGWFAVTNHSSITWKWGTNYWLGLSNTAGGTLDRTSNWYSAGTSISNMTATPSNHYHFGNWTGDTNGCTISSNRLSFTMTRARQVGASFVLDSHQFVVSTPYGTASPAVGTNLYGFGTVLSAGIVDSPVTVDRTRYACTGWSGNGSVTSSGSGTNTGSFSLDMDSSIAWTWRTQYLFGVSSDEGGVAQGPAGWQTSGSSVTATVTATRGFIFDRWVGDVPGGMESNNPLVLTMDQPRNINALVRVDTNLIRATHSAAGYRSPEVGRTVTCAFECPADRPLLSLAWLVTLPAGWQITSVTGNGSPEVQGNEIVFLGTLLTNRVTFSYNMTIPGNAATTNDIVATADFQLSNMVNSVGLPANPTPLRISRYHSADYKTNYWAVDSSEVGRFLSYWRTGSYQVNAGGLDGFMPGSGNTNGGYHSADYRTPRWVIDGTELNRVLSYWRGGGYHVDPAGNDGYVAGAAGQGMGLSTLDTPGFSASQAGAASFDPGQSVTVSNTFTFTGTLWSLLCRPRLPHGWVITGVTGDGSPEYALGEIVWTFSLPPSPIHLAYTVSIPASEHCGRQVTAEVEYQLSGMANESNTAPSPSMLTLVVRDQDNDGLPDTWENTYGGGATNLIPDADDDGDGLVNWRECIAGTNPEDSNSVLRVSGGVNGGPDRQAVSWQSTPNRWYTLSRCFGLADEFVPLATNLPATPPMNSYTDNLSSATNVFYRIEIEP